MRTRFPPSPTGFLHIGGLRTALFSYLVAKKERGTFYVRIEDTDQAREVEGATLNILKTLRWAGLEPDEGVVLASTDASTGLSVTEKGPFGPYFQSKRLKIYHEHIEKLLQSASAYPCFCSKERLDAMRKEQEARHQAPMYDRTCLRLSKEEMEKRRSEPHVIRFRIPDGKEVVATDHIRGKVTFSLSTLDDQVLLKSDGFPTYHLAHVVDDHLMETSLVIRGEEWLPSLPKHLLLFKAFGWDPPEYAHVPLLLQKGGGKLSKRQGDVSVEAFIEKGYLPEVLINFVALLGWNPGTTEEIFSLPELIEKFSLERVQKAGAIFDVQKLDWLQGQWMRKMQVAEFASRIQPLVSAKHSGAGQDKNFSRKAALIQERITFFREAPEMLGFFYEAPHVSLELLANPKQKITKEDLPKIVSFLRSTLSSISEAEWNQEKIAAALEAAIASSEFQKGQVLWPLRAALTGREYSPGAYEVATVLGKEETLKRLKIVL